MVRSGARHPSRQQPGEPHSSLMTRDQLANILEALNECIADMEQDKRWLSPGGQRSELIETIESMRDTRKRVLHLLREALVRVEN